jgi:hypothetical protein
VVVVAGLLLIFGLLAFLVSALSSVAPGWLSGLLGVLVGLAALVAMVYVGIRLSFWFIAVVADRLGWIDGCRASLRVTKGRWLKVAGLGLVLLAISFAIGLPFSFLEWIGNRIGGVGASIFGVIANVAGAIASLYVGFALLAAFIKFYVDAKPSQAAPPVPS